MRFKALPLVLLTFLASLCYAQLKVKIDFESAGTREIFVASGLPASPPTATIKADGKSIDFPLGEFKQGDKIFIWDRATGNIASKTVSEATAGWAPKAADFNIVGAIGIRVEHKGESVAAATVALSTKGRKLDQLLDPSSKGQVDFFGVPPGDVRVKVQYKTADKKTTTQEQVFTVALKRDKPDPVFAFSIAEDVATNSAPAAGTGATPGGQTPASGSESSNTVKPADQMQEGSPAGKFIFFLITILIIGGLGYWGLQMFKNNPKLMEEKLTKLGVQIPKPQDQIDDAPVPVMPLSPPPPAPKIILEDADPVPLGVAPIAAPISAPTGQPRLIGENGLTVDLFEGETITGREDGLGLSLAGESTVSRRHAKLTRAGDSVVLTDLGSTNGTFVNGNRLQGETALRPGDQVQFGSVRFRYEG